MQVAHAPFATLAALLVALTLAPAPSGARTTARPPADPAAEEKDKRSKFEIALEEAEAALKTGNLEMTRAKLERALEFDTKATRAWNLRARWAEAKQDPDELVYALHQELRLSVAQKLPASKLAELRARIVTIDPLANDLFGLSKTFIEKLEPLAVQYEKDKRPHSAIRVHKEILALDPERIASFDAIQRLASAPDPSLATDAKPKDLLADVSEEWIREHDEKHFEWSDRAKVEREYYVTHTNAGYACLVRAAEAMEQMNGFYRDFFGYGTLEDGRTVPRIDLFIFRTRDEYLKLGSSPAEWSGGQFTGGGVETYIGDGSFNDMVGVLFHESAHQFVSLATNASGWLNEGLASFFEGTRLLANGTVLMNLPATHRLFPLVERMRKGWMSDEKDGMNPDKASDSQPPKAPTFRIVLENKYEWGPPWYAPTWGVVYFLYNYQDPVDGRYVYRAAFRTFIQKSGGRAGDSAVKNFEEVVLANPQPQIKGVVRPKDAVEIPLPKTAEELDPVWRDWLLALAREQNGEVDVSRPYLAWARNALKNKDMDVAREHFEKALVATPNDVDALLEFAAFLVDRKAADRASKLVLQALAQLELAKPVDDAAVAKADKLLERCDPKRKALDTVHQELWAAARSLVQRYQAAKMPMMVMDLSARLGNELHMPELFDAYAEAYAASGKTLAIWQKAYNERSLDGWAASGGDVYKAEGPLIGAQFGVYSSDLFDFRMLTLDTVTSGDYSFEAEVHAEKGHVNFAGLLFGKKDGNNFHALVLFPGKSRQESEASGVSGAAFVDLATSYGGSAFKTWRHNPVDTKAVDKDATRVAGRHKLRIDVSGRTVDTWYNDEFLSTQEFPSDDVLRGNFGLIVGPGSARFGDLRYLVRAPHDPAARIERKIRMGSIETSGGGIQGSYLGRVPPWPLVGKWVQGERTSWAEKGAVPQVLVLWSTAQNEIVVIDKWVNDLAARHADVGLEIVSIVSPNDADKIAGYLAEHPVPGTLAVDQRLGEGIGDSFLMYSVDRFNLPRLLLLDIDQKVVWEGDPGFRSGEPWMEGGDSFIDVPLADLIERRKLKELSAWIAQWKQTGAPALAKGDLASALPVMRAAKEFLKGAVPEIDDARRKLEVLEGALDAAVATAASIAREGAEPALQVLHSWTPLVRKAGDKAVILAFEPHLKSKAIKDWAEVLKQAEKVRVRKASDRLIIAQEFVDRLPTFAGRFPRELGEDLAPVIAEGDLAKLSEMLTDAPQRPQRWLTSEYLHW